MTLPSTNVTHLHIHKIECSQKRILHIHRETNLQQLSEVFAADVIVSLEVDLTQVTGAHRIVLGVELVKAMECVPILYQ